MSDFWQSGWGRVIRQIGVLAAGTIPFVGAFASVVVKALDAETFRVKPKTATAPPPPKPKPTGAAGAPVFVELFAPPGGSPPAIEPGANGSGQVGGGGPTDFFKGLQTVSSAPAAPELTTGTYVAIGIAVLVLAYLLLSRLARR